VDLGEILVIEKIQIYWLQNKNFLIKTLSGANNVLILEK